MPYSDNPVEFVPPMSSPFDWKVGPGYAAEDINEPMRVATEQKQAGGSNPFVKADAIFRPNHYARFVIEPITFINANKLSYNIGNVIKYACRYDAKNGLEDLRKARRYLDIQIQCMERDERVKAGEVARDVWKEAL